MSVSPGSKSTPAFAAGVPIASASSFWRHRSDHDLAIAKGGRQRGISLAAA